MGSSRIDSHAESKTPHLISGQSVIEDGFQGRPVISLYGSLRRRRPRGGLQVGQTCTSLIDSTVSLLEVSSDYSK